MAATKKNTDISSKTKDLDEDNYLLSILENTHKNLSDTSEENKQTVIDFIRLEGHEKLKEAQRIISECIINASEEPDLRLAYAIGESQSLLKGYATLDEAHRTEIKKLMENITTYLRDSTRKRPFNVLMLASPGAGKSHFIKQLAKTMQEDHVQAVTFNMATMQSTDDMAQPIDEIRNVKINDQFPLLFLDEFDSDQSRYASLLPLLWDGEFHIGHRTLQFGKAVIVLAGSSPELPKVMNDAGAMRLDADTSEKNIPKGKLVDLLSRINGGVINIPDLDLQNEQHDRWVDKVCIAVELIKGRFGKVTEIPRSFLRFVAHTKFRYGVRSIAHLIDVIDSEAINDGVLKITASDLPIVSTQRLLDSSLKLHLIDRERSYGIVHRWDEFSRDECMVNVVYSELV